MRLDFVVGNSFKISTDEYLFSDGKIPTIKLTARDYNENTYQCRHFYTHKKPKGERKKKI